LILPVFGMVSEIIPVFSRKVLFGYEFMAAATAAITFISMGVWAHHMFTVGMSRTADLFFMVSTFLISIPTGIKFFNWLATMYGGRISLPCTAGGSRSHRRCSSASASCRCS
jgi:cytochrome c oxidase subunit 1